MRTFFATSRCGTRAALCRERLVDAAQRLRGDRRGAAAVEFAMVAPFLLGLLLPIADVGAYVYTSMQLQLASQAGAEYAARHDWDPNGILSAMKNAAPRLNLSTTDLSVPNTTDLLPGTCYPSSANCSAANATFTAGNVQACGCVDPTTGAMTKVACTNPRSTCAGSGLTSGVYYTIGAQMRFKTITGLQYPFIGNNSLMSAWATVRVQ
jgi:Flp pilus assembly protein TadG